MIARPTTEQLLLECARELREGVLPSVSDETVQVRLVLCETVLRNAAERCAHEIAWMTQEAADAERYGADVLEVLGSAPGLAAALHHLRQAPAEALHLDEVAHRYGLAGAVLSLALEAVLDAAHGDLIGRGEALLATRLDRERVVLAGWTPAGR